MCQMLEQLPSKQERRWSIISSSFWNTTNIISGIHNSFVQTIFDFTLYMKSFTAKYRWNNLRDADCFQVHFIWLNKPKETAHWGWPKLAFIPLIFLADYLEQNFSGNRNGYKIGSKNGFVMMIMTLLLKSVRWIFSWLCSGLSVFDKLQIPRRCLTKACIRQILWWCNTYRI